MPCWPRWPPALALRQLRARRRLRQHVGVRAATWLQRCERDEKGTVTVDGLGPELRRPIAPLDCGNSGSTMRMLSGILAAQPFSSELIGDASLSRRPMKRIIEPLTQMGAQIKAADGDRAPLRIQGAKLHAIDYRPAVASAQVKTSVLFAGLLAEGKTTVEEPARTRDHGELALRAFGAEVERTATRSASRAARRCSRWKRTFPEICRRLRSSCARPRCFRSRIS